MPVQRRRRNISSEALENLRANAARARAIKQANDRIRNETLNAVETVEDRALASNIKKEENPRVIQRVVETLFENGEMHRDVSTYPNINLVRK